MIIIKNKSQLISILKMHLPAKPCIVEAGAFIGKDTLLLSTALPDAQIHAFEPVPEIYCKLQEAIRHLAQVRTHPYALSAHSGTASFFVSEKPTRPGAICPAGSLLKPKDRLSWSPIIYPKEIGVTTITLDAWADQNNIDRIDFLWLDVQGIALPILQSSPRMISTLQVLWVEVEFIQAYENQKSYKEMLDWLASNGFTLIAKDFETTDTWFFGNILCIKKN